MSELSPAAQALIDAARHADDPTAADKLRVQEALYAKLGVSAAAAASTGAAGGNAGPSTLLHATDATHAGAGGAALATKLSLAVVVVLGVAIGGYFVFRGGDAENEPGKSRHEVATPVVRTDATSARSLPSESSEATRVQDRSSQKPAAAKPAVTEPAPPASLPSARTSATKHRARPIRRRVATARPAETAPQKTIDDLLEEKRLLTRAQNAARDGDAAHALAVLATHARKFPNGILAPERQGTRVLALCKLGRSAAAKTAAAQFLRRWSRHPMAQRIRRSCAAD